MLVISLLGTAVSGKKFRKEDRRACDQGSVLGREKRHIRREVAANFLHIS